MGLRGRLKRMEREAGPHCGKLRLPDGREVSCEREELFDALLAAIDGHEHRLLPYLRQMPSREGMPGVVKALERSEDAS